jgi:3-oxoacyl-[acyl-carrier protein] reductase
MVVVITGTSRGIGFEMAKFFARQKDTRIYALSRNKTGLGQLASECAGLNKTSVLHPVVFDLEEFLDKPGTLYKRLSAETDHIDVIINNAGLLLNKPFAKLSYEALEKIFRVNFYAPAMLIRELLPIMGKKGSTHVVNIGSMGGIQGSIKYPGLSYYSASKAALANLTECLSEEFKNTSIVFNCLALGSVQTEMLEEAFPGYKAPVKPAEMAGFIGNFALTAHHFMKGKIVPVSLQNP